MKRIKAKNATVVNGIILLGEFSMRLWNAVTKPFENIHRIFPTQQIEVGKMIDVCKKIPNVKK